MLKLIISGCNGYMGRVVATIARSDPDVDVVAGFDLDTEPAGGFPVYSDPAQLMGGCGAICEAGAVIDFSNPSALDGLLYFGISEKIPLVLCTTGYSEDQLAAIGRAAEHIPVFRSGNMSLGVNLMIDLVRRACAVLGSDFDVEIVERHHRRKIDAPSGTALMLADAAASALPGDTEYIFERQSRREPRGADEIGISAVRGGTIVGQHEVIFAGLDEVIEIRHSAASRDVFAAGALRAAKFIANAGKPGLYNMSDILS